MKSLINKLMARQARLLESLTPHDASRAGSSSAVLSPTPEAPGPMREAELAAIEVAFEHLAIGEVSAAEAALAPHANTAQDPRTLTTLSRVKVLNGDLDLAHALLVKAESLDAGNIKTSYFMAELLQQSGRHRDAIHYRRRVALSQPDAPAEAYLQLIQCVVKATPFGSPVPQGELLFVLKKLLAAVDLTDNLRVEAAVTLYGLPKQRQLAIQLQAAADPCPLGCTDVEVQWLSMVDWCSRSGQPLHSVPEAGIAGRRQMIGELLDVTIDPAFDWTPILEGQLVAISGLSSRRAPLKHREQDSPLLLNSDKTALLRLPGDVALVSEPALLVGSHPDGVRNLLEHVAALCIAQSLDLSPELPLVVGDDISDEQMDLLFLLAGDRKLIRVRRGHPTRFRHLWVPSKMLGGRHWVDPQLPRWLRQTLLPLSAPQGDKRKFYVTDTPAAGGQRLHNQLVVVDTLASLGFVHVSLGSLSHRELMNLLGQATEMVGLTSPLMQTMMLVAPGAKITLLQARKTEQSIAWRYFKGLSEACGHRVTIVDCAYAKWLPGQAIDQAAISADVDQLAAAVR